MTFMEGLLIFFIILFVYFLIVFLLKKTGTLEKYSISLYGPGLLLRTKKGRNFLKKLASKKRFWKAYGSFGIVFCFILMVLFVLLFLWQSTFLIGLTPEQKAVLPDPQFYLVLPGINPILPVEYIFYIILAFIVAIIVHEFSHGILTYVGDLKVKSMGILYLIVPIGAFVEPDEEQLKKTGIYKRMRVFAVGPLSNFVTFFICLLLFSFVFMSAVQPGDGLTVYEIYEDSPAFDIGIQKGAIITSVNETDLTAFQDPYDRIYQYRLIMNETNANDTIKISYIYNKISYTKDIELTDKYNYIVDNSSKGKGHTGIYSFVDEPGNLGRLKNPFDDFESRILYFVALPILGYFDGYNPITSPFTDSYNIEGPLGALPTDLFWILVNILYWVAWLNLIVGMFNVLPMMPLDGGFLFNDFLRLVVKKVKREISAEKTDKIVKNVTLVVSLSILFLILLPFFVKYL